MKPLIKQKNNMSKLDAVAKALLEKEKIDGEEFVAIFENN